MTRKFSLTLLLTGALIVAAVFGALTAGNASAATSTTTAIEHLGGRGVGAPGGYTSADLAAALGITEDELTSAYAKATSTALAEAVESGVITQTEADEISAAEDFSASSRRWRGWFSQNGIDYETHLAEALGISVADLQAAKQTAYFANLDQAVTDGTLTADQAELIKGQYLLKNDAAFDSTMQSAFESAVAQAVEDGVITQAQADLILENSANLGGWRAFGRGGHGPGGGHGRHGSPDGLWGDSTQTAPDSSSEDA